MTSFRSILVIACLLNATNSNAVPFRDALQSLISHDSTVEKSELNEKSAVQADRQAAQQFLPSLDGKASWTREKDISPTQQSAGLESQLNIFRFGGDVAQKNKSAALLRAAQATQQQTRFAAGWSAAKVLIDVLDARENLEIQKKLIALKHTGLTTVERLYKAGTKPFQDVEKLSLDVLSEEDKLHQLAANLDRALVTLAKQSSNLELDPSWPWLKQLSDSKEVQWQKLASQAQFSSVKIAESNVAANESSMTLKRSALLPSIDVEGKYFWARDEFRDPWQPHWSASLVLTVPLYERGANYYGLREAARELRRAELAKADAQTTSEITLTASMAQLRASVQSFQNREGISKRARKLYDLSMVAFQRGVLSVNDLLDDQSRLVRAEQGSSSATADAHRAVVSFCEAIGAEIFACVDSL